MNGLNEDSCSPDEVISFWFDELTPKDWFVPDNVAALDRTIRLRFLATHLALAQNVGGQWHEGPKQRLAAIIVLDQFPRNIYRMTPLAFASDMLALREAELAIASGAHEKVSPEYRAFFFMPFEHSEILTDQDRSVSLFKALGNEGYMRFAESHRAVVARFGRFPHRNSILNRRSTPEELTYLAGDENSGWGQE